MMPKLDYSDDKISIVLTYALFIWRVYWQFKWMGLGLGCGVAAMDTVVSFGGLFLFCSFSRGIAFLILLYPWVPATGLVCEWVSLQICSTMWEHRTKKTSATYTHLQIHQTTRTR